MRDLSDSFDGLVVPGTIAAFQAEGTKGFVLSLSARSKDPYVIDSRFPLFQNRLARPKKSHVMLAEVLGVPALVDRDTQLTAGDLDDAALRLIAERWIDFNVGFEDVQTKTFNKYAARLNEVVFPDDRQDPAYVLPPYAMVGSLNDGWSEVSEAIWKHSQVYGRVKGIENKLRRVLAADSPLLWGQLAAGVQDEELVAWVSGLEEFRSTSEQDLLEYGVALQQASSRGQRVFALYGGFLAVLLSRHGLTGASHGIGFGEHREWIELPSSGAPPARYYVPRLHRYVAVDLAEIVWRQFPDLVRCECEECAGNSPSALDYHGLMRHSVRARADEITSWVNLPTSNVIDQLSSDYMAFGEASEALQAPVKVKRRLEEASSHLAMWARIMQRLDS
ncbi:hypothetical protein GC088_03220 [Arthrobacter sp. JZ12]|uniref:hypothetical protein n=1 Tax=Arthrobacter sp. JZ12 TaxID=2654190 RepID=UPI002B49FC44|nr:hypothetical protein [Arthrobacter sp. JZ12]WRH24204.1 hypothetical protein GC088_03220 [Arthrobacter sp. JZ12]